MDPLRSVIALTPITAYLFVLGMVNLRRRPTVVSGVNDAAALSVALLGLVVVGPFELFMPEPAAAYFGARIWLYLLALYGLFVLLLVLNVRPRIVVYNSTNEQLRPVLARCAETLDDGARWAGDNLLLPKLGVQLHLDPFPPLHNVVLAATGETQNRAGWRKFRKELTLGVAELKSPGRYFGGVLSTAAAICLVAALWRLLDGDSHAAVAAAWRELMML